jgi:hypothetical protein
MQKISFYLLPNRIKVTTDVAGFVTENRQVYQRKIKLYKGIDNTLEFEVRNSEQRKDNVAGYDVVVKFFDHIRKNVFTVVGNAVTGKPGIMSVTVTQDLIANLDPQLLTIAASLRSDTEERILYSDADFGLLATVELMNGYNAVDIVTEELTVFNYEYDKKAYISEMGNFGAIINDDYSTAPMRAMEVELVGTYDGVVRVEVTKDKSTASSNTWTRLEDWDVVATPIKMYEGDYRYVRFGIYQNRSTSVGSGARFTVTKDNNAYTDVIVTLRGQGYLIGDTLTVKGSLLGGEDGVNDLIVVVSDIINGNTSAGNIADFTWSGLASNGSAIYESAGTNTVTRPPNPVDKIIIRN